MVSVRWRCLLLVKWLCLLKDVRRVDTNTVVFHVDVSNFPDHLFAMSFAEFREDYPEGLLPRRH